MISPVHTLNVLVIFTIARSHLLLQASLSHDPPFLSVGTEVSAKYRGAFCEAKVKKIQRLVKCKVQPTDYSPSFTITDDAIKGNLMVSV